jgi:tryptophan synthase alpha chain
MRLDNLFSKKEPIYMAHMYYGDPNENFSKKAIKVLCDSGVDIIEFGIPFSDPTSDGPVFQRACERALKGGMTPSKAIEGIRSLRESGVSKPIIVTSYYNIVYHKGIDKFIESIKEAGADGLIVPNVPYEEADSLLESGNKHGIEIIFLVAPTTPDRRLKEILKRAMGFLYVVSVTGVTGARKDVKDSTFDLIKRVRKYSNIPLLVGFGISKPEHARDIIAAGADGIITGSAIALIYEKNLDNPEMYLNEIGTFAKNIKEGCREGIGLIK